jgi:hypothetical protein
MESHRIWIANLQDMLMNHVCQGLLKTYSEILRLCGGHKIKYSIQTAMEGISHLTSHKINADYRILLESLSKIGYTEKNLNDLLMNSYSSYALSALKSAGIACEKLDPNLLTGPKSSAFIHEIYINVARNLWMRPDVLVDQNVPQLKLFVKEAVEQAVRSGVNLNSITAALAESKANLKESEPSGKEAQQSKTAFKPTIKDRLNMINGGRTLLDDDASDDDLDSDQATEMSIHRSSVHRDSMPSFSDEPGSDLMTIEDDDFAPDNMTITFDATETSTATATETKSSDQVKFPTVGQGVKKEYELSLEDDSPAPALPSEHITVKSAVKPVSIGPVSASISQRDKGDDLVIDLTGAPASAPDLDEVSAYTVFTALPSDMKQKQNSVHSPQESTKVEDIPGYLITDIVNLDASQSGGNDDEASQYTITLLSHSDMLSSRLSRLGVS